MRTGSVLAIAAVAALAGVANATVIPVGNLFLDGLGASAGPFSGMAPAGVLSVTLTGFANQTGGFAWQSDMEMIVTGPGGTTIYGPNTNTPAGQIPWDTLDPGAPQDGPDAQPINVTVPISGAAGSWDVSFRNGFDFNIQGDYLDWSDVRVTLNLVPAPGSLALLGLGGLITGRRRR